uniref:U-reduvitoxin-Pr12a n=1 Tax=Platymeris rhadamanthus TaxID=1134088 RepID=PI12A_PLARH|nr:RecName: Full=U-reduvitoxin-Pr12a; Short=U-RDTX-Pr12a; AltName: Full=Venom pacifastin domain peptide Pr12a; Contains: RecName: Full=U-reduvitoxin-Pr12a.1; Short=U-RDTX-Pr12a.1; Contains: RecName: Full=U-reduvitoxin-Pr12a.2; Short=U-RDTX-Pr12a.2; Flags: Precursor [Platymeris rhadamanthus]QHB21532.1 venom pacifastin domain peptide Pr12a [Platymeris rhadamanthus]
MKTALLLFFALVFIAFETEACRPGALTVAPDGCNMCTCLSNGKLGRCTHDLICPPRMFKLECEPGKPFKNDCNDCICSEDGLTAKCTRKLCIHKKP